DARHRPLARRAGGGHARLGRPRHRPRAGRRRPSRLADLGLGGRQPAGRGRPAARRPGERPVNVGASTPLLVVSGTAVVVLMVGLVPDRRVAGRLPTLLAAAGVLAALVVIGAMWGDRQLSYAGD